MAQDTILNTNSTKIGLTDTDAFSTGNSGSDCVTTSE